MKAESQVPESVAYMDVFTALYSINVAQRYFLFACDASQLRNGIQTGNFQLTFNEERIEQLKSDYQCARWKFGYRCNKNAKTFWFNIQILTKNTKKSAESATYLIKDAVKRFRNAI